MRDEFWAAFDDAEEGGANTIQVIANMAYQRWKDSIEELTDLVMVINHKCWEHYRLGNNELSSLYGDLYYFYYEKAINYLEKEKRNEDLTYFIRTLD